MKLSLFDYDYRSWLLDNDASGLLAVGSRRGEVLIFGDGEVKQTLQLGTAAGGVEALAAYSKVCCREPRGRQGQAGLARALLWVCFVGAGMRPWLPHVSRRLSVLPCPPMLLPL